MTCEANVFETGKTYGNVSETRSFTVVKRTPCFITLDCGVRLPIKKAWEPGSVDGIDPSYSFEYVRNSAIYLRSDCCRG